MTRNAAELVYFGLGHLNKWIKKKINEKGDRKGVAELSCAYIASVQ
jgi:hypothetical protein